MNPQLDTPYDSGFGLGEMHPGIDPWLFFPDEPEKQADFAEGWAAGQAWYQEKQDACDMGDQPNSPETRCEIADLYFWLGEEAERVGFTPWRTGPEVIVTWHSGGAAFRYQETQEVWDQE